MTRPPSAYLISQTLRQCFWDCYDHLLKLLVANFAAVFVIGGGMFMWLSHLTFVMAEMPPAAQALGLFFTIVLLGPVFLTLWLAPVGYFAEQVSLEKNPGWLAFWQGLRLAGPRCWRYFQLICGIVGVLLINAWFYIAGPGLPERLGMVRFFMGGLCFWIALLVMWTMLVGVPATIRMRIGARSALRLGFVTVLRYPPVLLGIFLLLVSFWIIGTFARLIGVILFAFSLTAMLANSLYDVLTAHEAAQEKASKPLPPPTSWKEKEEREAAAEAERMARIRYERTLRDILRPWEDS